MSNHIEFYNGDKKATYPLKSNKTLNSKDSCAEWQKLVRKYNDVDENGL